MKPQVSITYQHDFQQGPKDAQGKLLRWNTLSLKAGKIPNSVCTFNNKATQVFLASKILFTE